MFIFLINCSLNKSEPGVISKNSTKNEIDYFKDFSFEEYVNVLFKKNIHKNYPNINNFPD